MWELVPLYYCPGKEGKAWPQIENGIFLGSFSKKNIHKELHKEQV